MPRKRPIEQSNIIGIDPGVSGALACIDSKRRLIQVIDMPVEEIIKNGKHKKQLNIEGIIDFLDLHAQYSGNSEVLLEDVHAMPGQGVVSMFSFGEGFGIIKGILRSYKIPYTLVQPSVWKRASGIAPGSTKDVSVQIVKQLYPNNDELFTKTKDGRAEALLIALYGSTKVRTL